MSLRNVDMTDRELLFAVHGVLDADGVALSADIADALGIRQNGSARSPGGRVASRLSWMAANGLVQRIDPKSLGRRASESLWIITPFGEQVRSGRLPKAVERAIVEAGPGARVLVMRAVAQEAFSASMEEATAVRREYLYHDFTRPRRRRR